MNKEHPETSSGCRSEAAGHHKQKHLDIGYSLLAVGYSKKWECQGRVLLHFEEDNWKQNRLAVLAETAQSKGWKNKNNISVFAGSIISRSSLAPGGRF